jgi:chorismate mutase
VRCLKQLKVNKPEHQDLQSPKSGNREKLIREDEQMALRAIRGAIQLDSDEREHLLKLTAELLAKMMHANNMHTDQLVSILFTATPDITSEFPALAARELGLGDVPLMCFVEMNVKGALPRIVRVMINAELDVTRAEVQHVYLRGATALRLDIAQ